ncbi:hypothetical protein CVT26_008654 [Gymnopilus dilepis]|uniref:Uncharacterized protein n=1 Tax=Gymnopilus dilepis TaxID=231916 RepID=A0A409XXY3_9AGAR|nr:hypothetical protein CVT26_008654 [Gymnopilus dilepis]
MPSVVDGYDPWTTDNFSHVINRIKPDSWLATKSWLLPRAVSSATSSRIIHFSCSRSIAAHRCHLGLVFAGQTGSEAEDPGFMKELEDICPQDAVYLSYQLLQVQDPVNYQDLEVLKLSAAIVVFPL